MERLPPEGVTVAQLRDFFGRDSLMLLTAFLTLVFLIPVSIPGVSTVFGGAILLISLSRLSGRDLWLPQRIAKRAVSTERIRSSLNRGLKWFRRLERISRPNRLRWITSKGFFAFINNAALILGAVLLMAPFGLIPFSNTLPAVAILFLALGFMQRDGACILFGHIMNALTIVYFGVLIAGGGVAIHEAWQRLTG